jgi:hypothetical protein
VPRVARGRQALVEHHAGGGRRLGEDLGILQVEAAAEREPARGEHERGPAAGLLRAGSDPHGGRGLGREALGPDERHPQRSGALLRGAAHGGGGRGVVGERPAPQRGARRRRPHHLVEGPLDALGDEVRERAREIEEELPARALPTSSRPARPPCRTAVGEIDHVAQCFLTYPVSKRRSAALPAWRATAVRSETCANGVQHPSTVRMGYATYG